MVLKSLLRRDFTIIVLIILLDLPPYKQLRERLRPCTKLLHFEFYGEARPVPARCKNSNDKHSDSSTTQQTKFFSGVLVYF